MDRGYAVTEITITTRKITLEYVHGVGEAAKIDLLVVKVDGAALCVDRLSIGEGTRIHITSPLWPLGMT